MSKIGEFLKNPKSMWPSDRTFQDALDRRQDQDWEMGSGSFNAALQTKMDAQHITAMEQQLMQQAAMQNQGGLGSGVYVRSPGTWQDIYNSTSTAGQASKAQPRPDPNTMPEMQLSLADAHALWVAKFGERWVGTEELSNQEGFKWNVIAQRLYSAHIMEYYKDTACWKVIPTLWK